jgi:hypothetical protein
MPINTNLNISPYFDDFDQENQFYRVLFKPAYAVQARELIQLQTILQNQIEQFGDNIYKEGSIIKGCNFTQLDALEFVKLGEKPGFTPTNFISGTVEETISGVKTLVDVVYTVTGGTTSLEAEIVSAQIGYTTRPPDLNTFFVNYLNTTEDLANSDNTIKQFNAGETLSIYRSKTVGGAPHPTDPGPTLVDTISVAGAGFTPVGKSFGLKASPGIIFQKGHFLFTTQQTLVVEKYSRFPNNVSVGFKVDEQLISFLQDPTLYDNANGSRNENAPGADRLKLVPDLVALTTATADIDSDFFTLIRYETGNAIELRDVTQFNVLGEEMARRTYEESGNYVAEKFIVKPDRRYDVDAEENLLKALVSPGVAYIKGFRVENAGEREFTIPPITSTTIQQNEPVGMNYGNYVDVTSITGVLDIDFTTSNLQDGTGATIGECFVRNLTPDRAYIFGVRITNAAKTFADVERISSGTGYIGIAAGSTIKGQKQAPMIFDTGTFSLKEITDMSIPRRVKESSVTPTGTTITIPAGPSDDFNCNNDDVVVVDSTNTRILVGGTTTTVNDSNLVIALNTTPTGDCTVYFNKRIQLAGNHSKLSVEPYIKVTYSASTSKYTLGFPDVYEIVSIADSTNGDDYTNSFRLKTNQKDSYYDISYMEYIPGRPKPPAGDLVIKLKVFQLNNASGEYYFTVNSYGGIDDTTPDDDLPSTSYRSNKIPVYRANNGRVYNLRECFDFRPYVDKNPNALYTQTLPGGAPTISGIVDDTSVTFTGSTFITPSNGNSITCDIEHYMARIDVIAVDSFGRFDYILGTEEESPVPPRIAPDQLQISKVVVPGLPALTPKEAAREGKKQYAIKMSSKTVENYTMRDIKSIEKRLEAMEYYIQLNQLETETTNLLITDENGLTRFKNGYIVDPLNNLDLANVQDNEFNASVPFDKKQLQPAVRTFPLDLRLKSTSSASVFPNTDEPEAATLSRDSHISVIKQPYASGFRNAVSNFYKYVGLGDLFPAFDSVQDTVADPVSIDINLVSPFADFLENVQQFIPLTGSVDTGRILREFGGDNNWFPTQVAEVRTWELSATESVVQSDVGEFASNVEFNPFMRSRDVNVYMAGLRPNTRHYFFFDGVDVNDHVFPGTSSNSARAVNRYGAKGDPVVSDASGVIRAVFSIPSETFYCGDRNLEVVDVDTYSEIGSGATSIGTLSYHAWNINVEKTTLTQSTRVPATVGTASMTERNLARRPRPQPQPSDDDDPRPTPPGIRGVDWDPLAQTFFIKGGMGRGSGTIFASKIDLYFKKKSTTQGVTVMLREVVNGYPSTSIIPFSKIHLNPEDVNISDDSSVATTIDFTAPVRLDVEKEYSVVIMPDGCDPNYLLFTSKVGGTDLTPGATNGQAIVQDWGDGVLFTSTNNKAWQSYQDEDLKFTLYRHNFSAATGSITLTQDANEFFTLTTWNGEFKQGERVYREMTISGSTGTQINIPVGSNILTGTTLTDTYNNGDFILVTDTGGGNIDIFEVVSVDSDTQITLNKPSTIIRTNHFHKPVVTGVVSYYNPFEPNLLYLRSSNASGVRIFGTGSTILGLDSGTEATISTVDNVTVSYIQPMIYRSNDTETTTSISGSFVDATNTLNNYTLPMRFGASNHFTNKGNIIYSKSNDTANSRPFDMTISMTNNNNTTSSPFIDLDGSSVIAYQYKITNTEDTSKYVSKTIELKEDLDAEDMEVFVTGYRPAGSDIKLYIKPQNQYDPASFENADWIEMELFEGVGSFSSSANLNDFREFKYRVPATAKNGSGVLEYTNTAGTFTGYRKFAIKIELRSPNQYSVPFVKDYRGIALT